MTQHTMSNAELDMEDVGDAKILGVNDAGQRVVMQQAFPAKDVEEYKYYYCTKANHHMIRADGKRILFIHQVYKTKDYYDQRYLENEIRHSNEYVRRANQDEIDRYNMIVDPRGTMREQLKPQIEEEVTAKLMASLRAQLKAATASGQVELTEEQINELTSGNLLAGVGDSGVRKEEGVKSGSATLYKTPVDTSSLSRLRGIVGSDKLAGAAVDSGR